MPELPEVETIRLQLNQALKGLKIAGIEVLKAKSFQGDTRYVIGETVTGVERRAKMILVKLDGDKSLVIHLKMTGQLIFRGKEPRYKEVEKQNTGPYTVKELPNKYTRVIINFTEGSRLYFNDVRIFGWVRVVGSKGLGIRDLEKIGPEANDDKQLTMQYFQKILATSKKPVKLVILDQEKLAGVGNIYANEALFMAGIRPDRRAKELGYKEAKKLRETILQVLKEAIKHKGTSAKDDAYRQVNGQRGQFQNYLLVYGKKGLNCPKCGHKIERIKIGGRGTFFCPKCQK